MEDIHTFGEKDYLDADELGVGSTIKVTVLEYAGRRAYADRWAAYYVVQTENSKRKFFRLSISNEQVLAKFFGMKSYEALIGKTLTLTVKHFKLGHNGFVITQVNDAAAPMSQSVQQKSQTTIDTSPPATEAQIRKIYAISNSDEAKEIVERYLDTVGKSDITQLTKPQASKLIDEILENSSDA